MRTPLMLTNLLFVAVVAGTACGGADTDVADDGQLSPPAEATTNATAVDTAGNTSDGDTASTAAPSGRVGGSCSVEVTGAVTDSYTGGQGIGEAYATAWVPAEQQAQADAAFPGGAPDFQVGCTGPAGQVLVSLFELDVPLGATAVPVPANLAGYFSSEALIGNREPVEIELSRFDETGMAGTLTFTGEGSAGESTVTMTFDFTNDWAS